MNELDNTLNSKILNRCDPDLLYTSRVHRLPSFDQEGATIYVKREDESGFGVSGCKKRKYASLLPWLKQHNYEHAVVIGGSNSNHVPAIAQLLNENRINAHIFLKGGHTDALRGNELLTHILEDKLEIVRVDATYWHEVEKIADSFIHQRKEEMYMIPEGGSCRPALPGSATLLLDIIRNEEAMGIRFDHIFIDAGTGMMAAILALMNRIMQRKTRIHTVLIAGNKEEFHARLEEINGWIMEELGISAAPLPYPETYFPVSAKSFGSINTRILEKVIWFAREEGILTDPVYTTKLFFTAKEMIKEHQLKGKVLIIHSGGGTGLMGFDEKLSKMLLRKGE